MPSVAEAVPLRGVLNTLADARLVSLGEDSAEVAHEALIREWQRLREWLNQDRDELAPAPATDRCRARMGIADRRFWRALSGRAVGCGAGIFQSQSGRSECTRARVFDASQHAAERGPQNANRRAAQVEAAQRLAAEEQRHASESHRTARQLRRRAYFLGGAFLLAILLTAIALFLVNQSQHFAEAAQLNESQAQSAQRLASARELAASSLTNLNADPERSILLALQAVGITYDVDGSVTREALEALHRAVSASHVQLTLIGHKGLLNYIAYSPDGKHIATTSADKTAIIWDAATGQKLLTLTGHTDVLEGIAYSPDGRRIVTSSDDHTGKIWDAATGQELMTLNGHTDAHWIEIRTARMASKNSEHE